MASYLMQIKDKTSIKTNFVFKNTRKVFQQTNLDIT